MDFEFAVAGVVSVFLFVYLTYVLLNAEKL
jgi:K+-transporting ATPase KdpF subunit